MEALETTEAKKEKMAAMLEVNQPSPLPRLEGTRSAFA